MYFTADFAFWTSVVNFLHFALIVNFVIMLHFGIWTPIVNFLYLLCVLDFGFQLSVFDISETLNSLDFGLGEYIYMDQPELKAQCTWV